MSNYIRACFCISDSTKAEGFSALFTRLGAMSGRGQVVPSGEITGNMPSQGGKFVGLRREVEKHTNSGTIQQISAWLAKPGYLDVPLEWKIGDRVYQARILQSWDAESSMRRLSFDVEECAFFPGRTLEFDSADPIFESYKQVVIEIVRCLRPEIGVIDYEADLLCDSAMHARSLVGWGSVFHYSTLREWHKDDVETLIRTVDNAIEVDDIGLLVFIHPMRVNQAWTDRHRVIERLLQRYPTGWALQ